MNSWYFVQMKTDAEAEVLVYDEIGFWGITAKDFITDLQARKAKKVTMRINSPGGSVADGVAIYNYLRSEAAKGVTITAIVDGFAASIASVILLAADDRTIADGATVMIHNASTCVCGSADDFRKAADVMDEFNGAILDIYEARTGQSREDLAAWMAEETWMFGQDAVDKGFCTVCSAQLKAAACIAPRTFNFKRQPATAAATGAQPENKMKHIAKLLGLAEDATETEVAAAIAQVQNKLTEANAEVATITAERDTLRTAAATATRKAAETHVDAVIATGAIAAEAKPFWVDAVIADEGKAKAALATIKAPNAKGHAPLPPASEKEQRIISKAEHDAMTPQARAEFFRNGGKLTA